jgi:hypothetical protein
MKMAKGNLISAKHTHTHIIGMEMKLITKDKHKTFIFPLGIVFLKGFFLVFHDNEKK